MPQHLVPSKLPGQLTESKTNKVNLREIPSHVLLKVCICYTYKVRYPNGSAEIPEFPIALLIGLELFTAANLLNC